MRLVEKIEEFHKVGTNEDYVKFVRHQLLFIEDRLKIPKAEKQPLEQAKDELERKIWIIEQAQSYVS